MLDVCLLLVVQMEMQVYAKPGDDEVREHLAEAGHSCYTHQSQGYT